MQLGSHSAIYGWSSDAIAESGTRLAERGLLADGALTERGRTLREQIEKQTDLLEQPVVSALGAQMEPVLEALAAWSQRCVEAHTYPPDPYRRAGG